MKIQEIKLKLYLEGVETPFTSISITEQLGAAPVAQISLPAKARYARLWPNTLAHVFYKQDDDWYLIFEGEFTQMNFHRKQDSRGIVLVFSGLTRNWNNTYKNKVDFSLDTFMYGKYLMIGADGEIAGNNIYLEDSSNTTDTKYSANSKWLFADHPGTTITMKFKQAYEKFIAENKKLVAGSKTYEPLENTIKAFIENLSESNPYYALIHKALKISDRISVLENTKVRKVLKHIPLIEMFMQTFKQQLGGTSTGAQILQFLLSKIEYGFMSPAAPTAIEVNGKIIPKNLFFSPDLTFSLPLRCNTIFPDQVIFSTFNQDFLQEPTRMVASTPPLSLINASNNRAFSLRPKYIMPHANLLKDNDGNPVMGMTREEFIRGINPQTFNYDDARFAYITFHKEYHDATGDFGDLVLTDAKQKEFVNALKPPSDMGDYIRGVTNFEFLKRRYRSRNYSVATPYSPYRLIGFPGMVMDNDLPTVVGKIVNIQTTLSADGRGNSNVTFAEPRLYFDQEVQELTQDYDPFSDNTLNDFTDNWPNVPFWLDISTYGVNGVGKALSKLVYSDTTREDATINAFSDIVVEDEKVNSRINTRVALQSMQQLRILHKTYKDSGNVHVFIDKETKRDLVTESDFWTFLTGSETMDYTDTDLYKDVTKMKYNPKKYKRSANSSRLTNLEEFEGESKKTAPFVLQRRDQVIRTFNEDQ